MDEPQIYSQNRSSEIQLVQDEEEEDEELVPFSQNCTNFTTSFIFDIVIITTHHPLVKPNDSAITVQLLTQQKGKISLLKATSLPIMRLSRFSYFRDTKPFVRICYVERVLQTEIYQNAATANNKKSKHN
jgi:hypothetical protein